MRHLALCVVLALAGSGPSPAKAQSPARAPASDFPLVRVHDKAYVSPALKWQRAVIPVCWENPSAENATQRQWVRSAIAGSWEAHSAVKFIGGDAKDWGACAPGSVGIRILIADVADNGPHTLGLGTQIDGRRAGMVLNFTFSNWGQACAPAARRRLCIESIAVHEFGHALAFSHEQNRPDAPGECAAQAQGPNGTVMLTPYDPSSVMNYCNPVYNNNGVLSENDIEAVRYLYGGA